MLVEVGLDGRDQAERQGDDGEDQLAQLQRPGLALVHGRVVIAYGQNTGDCPGRNGPAHGYVVSIPERGGPLHYFQVGRGRDRGAVWMGGSSPVVDPHGNVYVASADGYDLGAGQPYDNSDAALELFDVDEEEIVGPLLGEPEHAFNFFDHGLKMGF